MAEISLILTSPGRRLPVTSIALADTGTGVASIPHKSINQLAKAREAIVEMMNGTPRMTSNELRQFGQLIGRILFSDEVGDTWNGAAATLRAAGMGAALATSPLITKLIATS